MQKKVFLIILLLASLVFHGCSSMKHSTIVLYVSHKVEGPLYMPEPEPPVTTRAPQTNIVNQRNESSQKKNPTRENQTIREEANQTNQNIQTSSTQTVNQRNETSQKKNPTRENQTVREEANQTNQNIQPILNTNRGNQAVRENQVVNQKNSESQDNQIGKTNTYGNYTMRTLPRGEFLVLENPIRFAFEKYYIGSSYDDTVQYVADFMKLNTNFLLVVEGHTDRVGEYRFNKNLSLRRSRAAISKLVQAGVPKNRLIESGVSYRFSEYNFNRLNRRVEFIIIRSPEDITNYREGIK